MFHKKDIKILPYSQASSSKFNSQLPSLNEIKRSQDNSSKSTVISSHKKNLSRIQFSNLEKPSKNYYPVKNTEDIFNIDQQVINKFQKSRTQCDIYNKTFLKPLKYKENSLKKTSNRKFILQEQFQEEGVRKQDCKDMKKKEKKLKKFQDDCTKLIFEMKTLFEKQSRQKAQKRVQKIVYQSKSLINQKKFSHLKEYITELRTQKYYLKNQSKFSRNEYFQKKLSKKQQKQMELKKMIFEKINNQSIKFYH